MSSRVTASLLVNCGLSKELIVNSIEEYEQRAIHLVQNREELQSIRSKLQHNREDCDLFAVENWIKDYEILLKDLVFQFK